MDNQINVIIIDENETSRKLITGILNNIKGLNIEEAGDFENGFKLMKQVTPDITILNLSPSEENALKLAKLITQKYRETALFVTAPKAMPDVIIQAMRAGAREFLTQPFNKDELIEAVHSIIRAKKHKLEQKSSKGKVIAVHGAKGGVGTTTIATNIASVLSHQQNKDVILVDLNLKLGNSALFFDIKPQYSILDVANNMNKIDLQLLKRTLPMHSSGVRILIGPAQIEEAESVSATHVEQTLSLLRDIFEFIIIDTNSVFDEVNIKGLDEADKILTVSTLDIPSIYNTKRCLDLFQRMGYGNEKVLLILNRYSTFEEIDVELIEKSLNYPVFWRIPNQSYSQILKSINAGIPISMMMPQSKISVNFFNIAKRLNGSHDKPQNENDNRIKVKFLHNIFKKRGN
jgi:pilus assembly protein CpaE